MSLSLPFGIEKALEAYPVELIEALFPLFILSSLAAFLPILSFITFLWSIYQMLGAGYELCLEIQGKPDIFPHSRSFHRRGDKILLPFICWLSFG